MLDFTELSNDGVDLELLVRDILTAQGFEVRWSGIASDGERDLFCIEKQDSFIKPDEKKWLVQCKHNARANRAVDENDLNNIVDKCTSHKCKGFLLVCSTYPSSALVQKLEGITLNPKNDIETTYWDAIKIERILTTPKSWPLAQTFFPVSSVSQDWRVYSTERPNNWVVNYKGYYFYLNNRIGSNKDNQFDTIANRVRDIEALTFRERHCLRIRAVYFDDKNMVYKWYLDYMFPRQNEPMYSAEWIAQELGDDHVLEDGKLHSFDVINRSYLPSSDHHDFDHYDYYRSQSGSFLHGSNRSRDEKTTFVETMKLEAQSRNVQNEAFEALLSKLSEIDFVKVIRSCNSEIEYLDQFYKQFDWSEIIEDAKLEFDRFFSSWFLFNVSDEERFYSLVTYFPQELQYQFRLTRPCIYLPRDDMTKRSERQCNDEDEHLYELTLRVHPSMVINKTTGRNLLNAYFREIIAGIDNFLDD